MQIGYYINLERMHSRREFMDSHLMKHGLEGVFKRSVGVDATNLKPESVENYAPVKGRPGKQQHTRWQLSVAEIAIFESHRRVWQQIVETGIPYAMILEDDVQISEHIHEVIEQIETIAAISDVVKLDWINKHCRFGPVVPGIGLNVRPIVEQRLHSAAAYLVSQAGARKLLEWSAQYSELVDAFIFCPRRNYRIGQLFPAVAMQGSVMGNSEGSDGSGISMGSVPDVGMGRRPICRGPVWFRLLREARLGVRRMARVFGGDRKLRQEGGLIGVVPLADDLKKYR